MVIDVLRCFSYLEVLLMISHLAAVMSVQKLGQLKPQPKRWVSKISYAGRFHPANMQQDDLFAADQQSPHCEALMQVIDKINLGRLGKVYFAARGRDTREWMMKREQLSPRYTTAIGELPVVK